MPALYNPRWEAFAQAIVKGLASDRPNGKNTAKAAYLAVGYSPTNDNAARAAASRLLTNVIPVVERIKELQAQALARVDAKLDISRERIGRRLDKASRMAESENNPVAMVQSELGLAKVFGLNKIDGVYAQGDVTNAATMEDVGRSLLQSVGHNAPTTAQIQKAIELNDAFVTGLERIAAEAVSANMH